MSDAYVPMPGDFHPSLIKQHKSIQDWLNTEIGLDRGLIIALPKGKQGFISYEDTMPWAEPAFEKLHMTVVRCWAREDFSDEIAWWYIAKDRYNRAVASNRIHTEYSPLTKEQRQELIKQYQDRGWYTDPDSGLI